LQTILRSFPPPYCPDRVASPGNYSFTDKTDVLPVRDLETKIAEAELSGDVGLVRELLAALSSRKSYPAKLLIFHEDARPGYLGTWTKKSSVIGPRRPFARDALQMDYSYDSGEDWDEEPAGDDVAEDADEEDVEGSDKDSDMESWLVDDDEDVGEDVSTQDLLDGDLPIPDISPAKRKQEPDEAKAPKKRKVVVPLVPFAKGPCWESEIGRCEHDLFKTYQMKLFNGTSNFPTMDRLSLIVLDYQIPRIL
jgi:chromatin assembly factor 1 subunit A